MNKTCYLIKYRDPSDGKIIELKAKKIEDSSLGLSFVAISEFIFETHSVLVNPEEESKKKSLENTKTLHLSIYSILSVSEVGEHTPKLEFKNDKAQLLVLKANSDPNNLN